MSKGGIIPRKDDGSTDHLFKSTWYLGETVPIRVPRVLKKLLIKIAKSLDVCIYYLDDTPVIAEIKRESYKAAYRHNDFANYRKKLKYEKLAQDYDIEYTEREGFSDRNTDKYRVAKKLALQYFEIQGFKYDEMKKSRRGTYKREFAEFIDWCETIENYEHTNLNRFRE